MKKALFATLLLTFLCTQSIASSSKMADSINQFTLDVGKYLSQTNPNQNAFLSPLSISSALSMAAVGAKGSTLKEMQKTLKLSANPHKEYKELLALLSQTKEAKLHLANRLWSKVGIEDRKEFLDTLTAFYGSSVQSLDFVNSPEPSRLTINKWIAEQTQNKILDLLPVGSVTPSTSSVLTNAIYFKGQWEHPFKSKENYEGDFFTTPSEKSKVTFMQTRQHIPYNETSEYQSIEFPYKNQELKLVVLLPKADKKLADIEKRLTIKDLKPIDPFLSDKEVDISFPKFTSEISYELSPMLQSLGIKSAFNPRRADFSGMRNKKSGDSFFISNVIHKSFIELSEEGTEAAAATAIIMKATAMPTNRVYFHANRPFIYFIRHEASGAILFYGKFIKP